MAPLRLRRITNKAEAPYKKATGATQPQMTRGNDGAGEYAPAHTLYHTPSYPPIARNLDIQQHMLSATQAVRSARSSPTPIPSLNGAPSYFKHASDFVIHQQNIHNVQSMESAKTVFEC